MAFCGRVSGPSIDTARYVYDDAVDVSEKSAVVDWYYKKNGALHFCKFVNGTVLYASENDPAYAQRGYYDHGKYPFVFDTLFPVEGSPCGFGYIDVMKGCQQAINELDRSIVRNAKACSRARYFVRDDGGVNEKEFMDLDSDLIHTSGSLGEDALRQLEYAPLSRDICADSQQQNRGVERDQREQGFFTRVYDERCNGCKRDCGAAGGREQAVPRYAQKRVQSV